MLIKICRRNKTSNEEAIPDLVVECNNFKKMIKIESESIQELKKKTDEIKKLTKKFVANCCEKIENETNLQKEIEQTLKNRNNFKDEVEKYDEMITEELEEKRKQLNDLKHSSVHVKEDHSPYNKTQKAQQLHEEDNLEEIYQEILKHVNIEDENYRADPVYQRFLDGLAKKREFESVLEERRMEL